MAYSTVAPRVNKTMQYNPYAQTLSDYGFGYQGQKGFGSFVPKSGGDGFLQNIADNSSDYLGAGAGALGLYETVAGNFDTSHLEDRDLASASRDDSSFDTSFHKANEAIIEGVDAGTSNPLNQAISGASSGAAIGSVIPGVGTVLGAGIGGLVGGVTSMFGNKKKKRKAAALRERLRKEASAKLESYADRYDDVLESRHEEEMRQERFNKIRSGYMGVPTSFGSFV